MERRIRPFARSRSTHAFIAVPGRLRELDLATTLEGFKIRPRTIRLGPARTARGYLRSMFEEAWTTWLDDDTPTQSRAMRRPDTEGDTCLSSIV
jgi:hypothetical protein